mmetsp:Transcript_28598/g.52009  ORF Transcript_28598/g.52009 Transcript_28598/m.52009 type:complete len:111 (-) Transcript_28598:516-848(-)
MVKFASSSRVPHRQRRWLVPVVAACAAGLHNCFVGQQHLAEHLVLKSRPGAVSPSPRSVRLAGPSEQLALPYQALDSCEVLAGGTGKPVKFTSLWEPGERAVVIFGRSFG